MLRSIVLSVLAVLVFAAPADARRHKPNRMTFEFAVTVAFDYWAKRGFVTPCQPQERLLSKDETPALEAQYGFGIDMAADPNTCEVLVTPAAEFYRTDRVSRLEWLYCTDVVHELGHLAGLEHDAGGIMDPERRVELVPFGCAHPRQWKVLHDWRKPPRWVRASTDRVQRLWLAGHTPRARALRDRLQAERDQHHT